ncbi:BadF/BadG/BcrA/BcrD ATPase family protein, partial [Actinoplanes sp. NPDC051633]|uniref:N-acetylglucosamine kinase n=1 Tax=Actinoplanes sp. NPDC051633 TaxID=3155670 RepID=UPI003449DD62
MDALVVGVDAGATSTRCAVATLDGRIVGRGVAGGANQNSSGVSLAASLGAALEAALSSVEGRDVRLGVLGGAGSAGAGREGFRAAATAAWRRAGLPGAPVTVTDLEVGYAAGTASPDGVLLLAGTGALAARFTGGVLARRVDGYGWLAGDEGSAVWIGIRALRAALAALDGRGEPTVLVEAVRTGLGVPPGHGEDLAQALLAAGFAIPPAALGRLAPAVSAAEDDPVARRIRDGAVAKLLHKLDTIAPPPGAAVVLAGSVLLSPGPIARAVRAGVAERTGIEPSEAADGA